MSFCPRCGKPTEQQFCSECMRELHPLVQKIGRVQTVMCPMCLKVQTHGGWLRKELQQVVEKLVEKNLTYTLGAEIEGITLEAVAVEPGSQAIQLSVIGSADGHGEHYEEYYQVQIHIQGNRCPECEHTANTYFTGIVQLRNPNDEVASEIERLLGKACTQVKDVTGGIDYYVSDHRIVQRVAREVHERFGGELKIRAQHFSYDSLTSKNLYRVNASIRLPKFWRGSVIRAGLKLLWIKTMGKLLKGIDVATGKIVSAPCKNEYEIYPQEKTTIVTTRPSLTVLEPDTYQTVPIMNASTVDVHTLEAGQSVSVTEDNGSWYILPIQ